MISSPKTINRGTGYRVLLASAALICAPLAHADASSDRIFALRNQNPFLQVFGLPTFQSAALAASGKSDYSLSLDAANHADAGSTDSENFAIDGETYFLTFSLRHRVTDWLELGVDLPLVSHTDGFMDHMIEGWHDLFGMSNTKRRGPSNELGFLYQRDGEDQYRLASPASGIGDLQLSAAVPLRRDFAEHLQLAIRTSVKLPTGDPDKLLGSGGTDIAIGLYATSSRSLSGRPLWLSACAGGLVLGSGDVLENLRRDAVAFGGVAATWQWTERIAAAAQLYGQGSYYDSDVEELGGNSLQLAVGLSYRTRRNALLRFAVVEDVSANATTDFALHFSVSNGGG